MYQPFVPVFVINFDFIVLSSKGSQKDVTWAYNSVTAQIAFAHDQGSQSLAGMISVLQLVRDLNTPDAQCCRHTTL